jgi:hypothetical protein
MLRKMMIRTLTRNVKHNLHRLKFIACSLKTMQIVLCAANAFCAWRIMPARAPFPNAIGRVPARGPLRKPLESDGHPLLQGPAPPAFAPLGAQPTLKVKTTTADVGGDDSGLGALDHV